MKKFNQKLNIEIFLIPIIFVVLMWGVKLYELVYDISFISYGVLPKEITGLKGILFSPFIHKDISHLINNTYPIILLGGTLFFFYKKIAPQIFFWLFFTAGLWLWAIGRPSLHIGASGVIYALASFIFVSGLIRKNPKLSAVSLIVVFLYGSLFWGILPMGAEVSWEGHLSGFLAGILIAIYYRKEGPSDKKYDWEIEEELDENIP
ncbi:MAG: rhomboid family intramembrane serine protease [Bacteroidota bacterium]|nr:rhomboid family intramembrane serine protease [Bacteroidota bacterium]